MQLTESSLMDKHTFWINHWLNIHASELFLSLTEKLILNYQQQNLMVCYYGIPPY